MTGAGLLLGRNCIASWRPFGLPGAPFAKSNEGGEKCLKLDDALLRRLRCCRPEELGDGGSRLAVRIDKQIGLLLKPEATAVVRALAMMQHDRGADGHGGH